MSRHVVIVGAGVAGLSAAFAARQRGTDVTVVSTAAGATALGGGAVDEIAWDAWLSAARTLGAPLRTRAIADDVRAFSDALGLWDLPSADLQAPVVATAAGRLRPARARDRGLLDLGSFGKTAVLLPRLDRAGWDADALAATLESEWLARQAGLRFLPVDAPILRYADETRISDADLAIRHDEPARVAWLAERLRDVVRAAGRDAASISGVLLGSWLGTKHERATELSSRTGVAVGEVLVGVGSSAGLRFEAAAERLLAQLSVKFVMDCVTELRRAGDRMEVVCGSKDSARFVADAVVLATGGLATGGVRYTPPDLQAGEHMPAQIHPAFSLGVQTVGLSIPLGSGKGRVDSGSSVFGPPLDTAVWPSSTRPTLFESVGIEAVNGQVCPGVYAVGDVVAGKRRTMLEAVAMGLRVGQML